MQNQKNKKIIALILTLCMTAGIFSISPAIVTAADNYTDREVARAVNIGFGAYKTDNPTVTHSQFMTMLDKLIELEDSSKLTQWRAKLTEARASNDIATRFESMLMIFEAAEFLGGEYFILNTDMHNTNGVDVWAMLWDNDVQRIAYSRDIFLNIHRPFEGAMTDVYGNEERFTGGEFWENAYNFLLSRISLNSNKLILDFDEVNQHMRFDENLTHTEALAAVVRLFDSVLDNTAKFISNPSPATIYVDAKNTRGGDGSQNNPFSTVTAAAKAAYHGDTILVADGTYHGAFTLPSGMAGQPTTLKAAPGAKPVITPSVPFNADWSVHSGNIYVADVGDLIRTDELQLFSDSTAMVVARYPNIGRDMSTVLERTIFMHAAAGTNRDTVVLPDDFNPAADLAGAEISILPGWGESMIIEKVSVQNGRTLKLANPIEEPTEDAFTPMPGNEFFIQNALSLLDAPGEYYYDAEANKLYFYAPDGRNPSRLNLSLKTVLSANTNRSIFAQPPPPVADDDQYAINLNNRSYVTVDGFIIYGGGVYIDGSHNILRNCTVRYMNSVIKRVFAVKYGLRDPNGIYLAGDSNTITFCEIGPTASAGITTTGTNNIITNNIIRNTNSQTTDASAISVLWSENLEVSNNTISRTGRQGIYFHEYEGRAFTGTVIKNNYFSDAMMLSTNDGGFILAPGDPTHTRGGATICYNFFEYTFPRRMMTHINLVRMGFENPVMIQTRNGIYPDSTINFVIHNNIIIGEMAHGINFTFKGDKDDENSAIYNNTIIGADKGLGGMFNGLYDQTLVAHDNLFVDVEDEIWAAFAKIIHGEVGDNIDEFTYQGDLIDGAIPADKMPWGTAIMSGNASGTVDEQFRPTGDTPNVGAVLRGEEMFEYGATWQLGDVPKPALAPATASPTASTVLVNGEDTPFDAYNIEGNNYFKLRDLAFVLNGTEKQFSVGWDGENDAISLTSGEAYAPVGGEMALSDNGERRTATPTSSKIYLNGKQVNFTAYNIGGNNYFKLRDIMQTFDVFVGWDDATSTITLDTSRGYAD